MKVLVSSMMTPLILPFLLAVPSAHADTIYQCVENGRALFTDEPSKPSCKPLNLQIPQPNPEDLARLQEKKRQQAERDRLEREEADRERLIRAQTEAARAAERQAEAQRRLAEEQAKQNRQREYYPSLYPFYGPAYGYPYLQHRHPLYAPAFRPQAPITPAKPSTPNYPYAPDQISVGRPAKK